MQPTINISGAACPRTLNVFVIIIERKIKMREETNRWLVAAQVSLFAIEHAMREKDFGGAKKASENLKKESWAIVNNIEIMVERKDFEL